MTTVDMPSNLYPREDCEVCGGSGQTMEWHGTSDCSECFSDSRVVASQIVTWLRKRAGEYNDLATVQTRAKRYAEALAWEERASLYNHMNYHAAAATDAKPHTDTTAHARTAKETSLNSHSIN